MVTLEFIRQRLRRRRTVSNNAPTVDDILVGGVYIFPVHPIVKDMSPGDAQPFAASSITDLDFEKEINAYTNAIYRIEFVNCSCITNISIKVVTQFQSIMVISLCGCPNITADTLPAMNDFETDLGHGLIILLRKVTDASSDDKESTTDEIVCRNVTETSSDDKESTTGQIFCPRCHASLINAQ
jgi:hypothetical protein